MSTANVHQLHPTFLCCSQLTKVEMPHDGDGQVKPGKPCLKGLEALRILRHDSPDRRAVLARAPGVGVVKWVIGFDRVSELVAGSEILGKLGHVEEPVIVPVGVQSTTTKTWKVVENGVRIVEEMRQGGLLHGLEQHSRPGIQNVCLRRLAVFIVSAVTSGLVEKACCHLSNGIQSAGRVNKTRGLVLAEHVLYGTKSRNLYDSPSMRANRSAKGPFSAAI
jgi:hypothetical protein